MKDFSISSYLLGMLTVSLLTVLGAYQAGMDVGAYRTENARLVLDKKILQEELASSPLSRGENRGFNLESNNQEFYKPLPLLPNFDQGGAAKIFRDGGLLPRPEDALPEMKVLPAPKKPPVEATPLPPGPFPYHFDRIWWNNPNRTYMDC